MTSKQEKTNVQVGTPKKSSPTSTPTKKLPQTTSISSIPQPPTIPMANPAAPATSYPIYSPQVPAATFISVPTPVGTIQVPILPPTTSQTPSYYTPYCAMPYGMMPSYGAYPMMHPMMGGVMPMKKKKKKKSKKQVVSQETVVADPQSVQQSDEVVRGSPEPEPANREYLSHEDAFDLLDSEFSLIEEGSLEIVVADEQEVMEKRGVKRNMEEVMDEILSNERAAKRMRSAEEDEDYQDFSVDLSADNVVILDTGFVEGESFEQEDEEDEQSVAFAMGEHYSSAVASFTFGMDEAF